MKGSKLLLNLFVAILILGLTFSPASAGTPPESQDNVSTDGTISVDAYPQPLSPGGGDWIYTKLPVFYFSEDVTADKYRIEVYNLYTTMVEYEFTGGRNCVNHVCSLQPTTKLDVYNLLGMSGEYKWRVRSRTTLIGGIPFWRPYSGYDTFYVMAKKIKAPFDADPVFKNWMQFISTWYWLPAKGQIKTYGTLSSRTTLLHTYLMSNFEYTVRMKRKVATYNPNFILIYGYPTPMAADGSFYDGLYFQYANDGSYYVYQRVDGVNYQLVGWTESDAIVPYGWNELKVLGNLPYVDLWINGTYLGWVELNGGAGNVGFGMLTTVADSPLLVDWAYANAYYVTVQREHDPAMQLGSNPLPVTDEEFNNAH